MECGEFSSESDSSILSSNVSRLITEEDFIGSTFCACDCDRTGVVPVSKLIEYLKFTATTCSEEGKENVNDLERILDPTKEDVWINVDTYRAGFAQWTTNLSNECECESFSDCESIQEESKRSLDLDLYSKETDLSSCPKPSNLRFQDQGTSICDTSRILSTSNLADQSQLALPSQDGEVNELMNLVEDLKFQNRRISEENLSLSLQLQTMEDWATRKAMEVDELKKTIKSHLSTIERLQEVREESLELKNAIATLEDTNSAANAKISAWQKENSALTKEVGEYIEKMRQISDEHEKTRSELRCLQDVLLELRGLKAQAEEHANLQEIQLTEKSRKLEQAESEGQDMKRTCESLRKDKAELELQLTQTQQDLTALELKAKDLGYTESTADCGTDDESFSSSSTVKAMPRPIKITSIGSEIRSTILNGEPDEPSPISKKEMDFLLDDEDKNAGLSCDWRGLEEEVDSTLLSLSTQDPFFNNALELGVRLKQQYDNLHEELRQLAVTSEPEDDTDNIEHDNEAQLRKFAFKVAALGQERETSKKTITKLQGVLRILKERCTNMKKEHLEDTVRLHSDFHLHNQSLQEKLAEVCSQLKQQTGGNQKLMRKLNKAEENVCNMRDENQNIQEMLNRTAKEKIELQEMLEIAAKEKKELQEEKDRLNSANANLTGKYQKCDAQMTDMKQELGLTTDHYTEEKIKNDELQDSLLAAQLARQIDMRDLWRLVQKDVENECQSGSQGTPISVSAESLKDQISQEIQTLQSQLAKSQAALSVLHTRSLPLARKYKSHDQDSKNNNAGSPGSPLVDALTLDFFDGSKSGKPECQTTGSVDSILDDEFDTNFTLRTSNTTSCPLLGDRLVSSSTQTDNNKSNPKLRPPQIGASKYTAVNISTGSSTSGVDVSSSSTRSESQDNIYHTKKSVFFVDPAQSPETPSTPEDGDITISRHRTSSFKKAIEFGHPYNTFQLSVENDSNANITSHQSCTTYVTPASRSHLDTCASQKNSMNQSSIPSLHLADRSTARSDSKELTSEIHRGHSATSDHSYGQDKMENRSQGSLIPNPASIDEQSPLMGRRLSTLVEEGSDAEVEDNATRGHHARLRDHSTLPAPSALDVANPEKDRAKTPPLYRAPPPYKTTAKPEVSRESLQNGDSRNQSICNLPDVSQHSVEGESHIRVLRANSCSPVLLNVTPFQSTTRAETHSPPRNPHPGQIKDGSPVQQRGQSHSLHSPRLVKQVRPLAESTPRSRLKKVEESHQKDGHVDKLANGQLAEVELTENEKLINVRLIEEARRVSATSKHRSRRPRRGSADLIRSKSFDEGGDDEKIVDTFSSSASQIIGRDSLNERISPIKTTAVSDDQPPKPQLEQSEPVRRPLVKQSKMTDIVEALQAETEKASGEYQDSQSHKEKDTVADQNKSSDQPHKSSLPTPAKTNAIVFPSLPDQVLIDMGLHREPGQSFENQEQFSEQDVEEKFVGLALAFKTDALTLEKRMELHKRARDIAEQNIEKELQGLKETMKSLSHHCAESHTQEVYTRMQHHVEVLEQSATRMSSRSEIHGAVQQEYRTSKSIEVMIQHVENLKRVHEKEHHELEDTRKLLQENNLITATALPDRALEFLQKRSMSIVASSGAKGGRRRASVAALPRAAMGLCNNSNVIHNTEVKARWHSLVSDTASSLSSGFRRASFATSGPAAPRRVSLAIHSSNNPTRSAPCLTTPKDDRLSLFRSSGSCVSQNSKVSAVVAPVQDFTQKSDDSSSSQSSTTVANTVQTTEDTSKLEDTDAFNKGFEEGVKATVHHELCDLRNQQVLFHEKLEKLMEETGEEDYETETESLVDKCRNMIPPWAKTWQYMGQRVRYALGGLVFLMAFFIFVFTLIPLGSAAKSDSFWLSWEEIFLPHTNIKHLSTPPF